MGYTTAPGAVISFSIEGAETSQRQINSIAVSMSNLSNTVQTAMRNLTAAVGLGGGLVEVAQMSDQYAKLTSQLRLATDSARGYAAAYSDVKRISAEAQTDLAGTGVLYARIANGTHELGISQQRVAAITEAVNLSLKVSAATTEEAASAQLQLSQAFASGTLRGEEFNAVNEAAPRLMKALADGMGVPVGALKQMASEGKITSEVMANVLPNSLEQLRQEAAQVQTIGGAFTVLKNNVLEFTATNAQANGSVAMLTGGIKLLSDNLTLVAGAALTLSAAKLGTWLDNSTQRTMAAVTANRTLAAANLATAETNATATASASLLANARLAELRAATLAAGGEVQLAITTNGLIPAQARAAAAAEAHAVAMGSLAVAQRAASGAAAASSAVIGALGGPIGAVITGLGLAATAWSWYASKSDEANRKASDGTEQSTSEIVQSIEKQNAKLRERIELGRQIGMGNAAKMGGEDAERLASLLGQINDLKAKGNALSAVDQVQLINLEGLYNNLAGAMGVNKTLRAQLDATGSAATDLVAVRERLLGVDKQYLEDLVKLQEAREKGSMGEKEYIEWVSKLATETYRKSEAGKASLSAAKAEQGAYESLISSIRTKIAAGELEMNGYDKLAESQKLTIKLNEDIVAGEIKAGSEKEKTARAMIAQRKAQEDVIASQKRAADGATALEKIVTAHNDAVARSIENAVQEANKNEELARTFGMTKAAIEAAELARLEEQLAQRAATGLTLDEIEALEKLIDAKKRSSAALASLETMEANKKAFDQMEADAKRSAEQIGQSLTDNIMRGGKSGADYVRDLFRTLVLRPILSPIGNAIGSAVSGAMMPGVASAAGTNAVGSAMGNFLGTGAGLMNFGGSAIAGLGNLVGASSLSAFGAGFAGNTAGMAMTASETFASAGMAAEAGAASLGASIAAAAPYVAAIVAAVAIAKSLDHSGTYHTGGAASASAAGVQTIRAESLNFEATRTSADTEKMTAGLASGIVNILDSTALAFGKTAGYTAATAFADDTSKDGAWGGLVISKLGEKLVDWQDTRGNGPWAPKLFADGAAGQQQYLAALSGSVRTALDGIGLPDWAKSMLDALGTAPAIEDLAKVVDNINVTQRALKAMGDTLDGFANLSSSATSALIKASGGIDALTNNANAYYQAFYSDAERADASVKQMTATLAAFGLQLPETNGDFRALAEAEMRLGEEGAPVVAEMFKMAGTYGQLHPLIVATNAALKDQAAAQQLVKEGASSLLGNVDSAFSVVQSVIAREKATLQTRIDAEMTLVTKVKALSDSTHSALDSMRATGQEGADRAAAQAQIKAALAITKAGGTLPSADSLKTALSLASQSDPRQFSSYQDYLRDFYSTQNDIADLADLSDNSLAVEQKTLDALQAEGKRLDDMLASAQMEVDIAKGQSTTLLSIDQAIKGLTMAILASQSNPVVSATAAINRTYQTALGRAPDSAGLAFWQDKAAAGVPTSAILDAITNSPEAKLQGLYHSLLGRDADAGGMNFFLNSGASIEAIRAAMMGSDEYKRLHPFAVGTNYIPEDMPALVHAGERIIPAADNRELMRQLANPAANNSVLVAAIARLEDRVGRQQKALDQIAESTAQHASQFNKLTAGGNAMLVESA